MRAVNYLLSGCLLIASLVGGCATHEAVDYLTLASPTQAAVRSDAPPLSLGPVTLPDYLKRNGLARRDSNGALRYSMSELWAEPLDQGIQRTLIEILTDALDGTPITSFPGPSALPAHYGISISVRRLEATDSVAKMAVTWRILPTSSAASTAVRRGRFSREATLASASGPAVARALSDLLHALALEIAAEIPATDS